MWGASGRLARFGVELLEIGNWIETFLLIKRGCADNDVFFPHVILFLMIFFRFIQIPLIAKCAMSGSPDSIPVSPGSIHQLYDDACPHKQESSFIAG